MSRFGIEAPERDEALAWGEDEPSEPFAAYVDHEAAREFAALCARSDEEDARIRAAGGDPDHECEAAFCPACAA